MKSRLYTPVAFVFCVFIALFSSGCASIVHNGSRSLSINSSPAGATVVISKTNTGQTVHTGVTPMTVTLPPKGGYFRGQAYTVRFKLEGYQTSELQLSPSLSGWYFGNIIFGGLIGMIVVDPLTGAMWNLAPDQIQKTLYPTQAQFIREKNGFAVVLLSSLSEEDRKKLVRIN